VTDSTIHRHIERALVQTGAVESPSVNWFAVPPRFVQPSLPLPLRRRSLLYSLALVSGPLDKCHFFLGSTSQPAPLPHKHYDKEATPARSSLVRVEDPTGLLVFEAALYIPHALVGRSTWKVRIAPRHMVSKQHRR
jgi:hypothetical protein